MSRTSAIRDPWHPQTVHDREMVLRELHDVLASPHFCNSKRYPALLRYIVEKTLAGEADHLKERTLGVEVFERQSSYDTNADTVVRYTAGEVRKRLSLYYHELERKPAIQISLPAGSYVPEFLHAPEEADEPLERAHAPHDGAIPGREMDLPVFAARPGFAAASSGSALRRRGDVESPARSVVLRRSARRRWLVAVAIVGVAVLAGAGWRYRPLHARSPLDDFWAPVMQNQPAVMVCIGGSVFAQNNFSGVVTAGKDIDYPFVSLQSVSAIAQLSAMLERLGGAATQLQTAATTPLTELREHPVILLGGYNNQWTLRLLEPLRFHFTPEPVAASIADATQPNVRWERDHTLPYSSADDYAVVARFRDATTDSWVVTLAGVGRNGTEAAANFATSPHYMQLLRDRVGNDFASHNVEAVLKVNVIDGKTGAPSILAVYEW